MAKGISTRHRHFGKLNVKQALADKCDGIGEFEIWSLIFVIFLPW